MQPVSPDLIRVAFEMAGHDVYGELTTLVHSVAARQLTETEAVELLGVECADADEKAPRAALAAAALALDGPPTFNLLCDVHLALFAGTHAWAGRIRTVEVNATGEAPGLYPRPVGLNEQVRACFDALERRSHLAGLDAFDFAEGLHEFWAELTRLHPFRDGNTRSQTILVDHIAQRAGWQIDWASVDPGAMQRVRLSAAMGHPHKIAWYLEDKLRPIVRWPAPDTL